MNRRIRHLQKALLEWRVDALVIENPIDLFYLTGLHLSLGRLWIYPDKIDLWVDGRYFGEASKRFGSLVTHWTKLTPFPSLRSIGFDSAWTTVDQLDKLKNSSPDAEWLAIRTPLRRMRMLKDEKEIEELHEAAKITWLGVQHIQSLFCEGVSEEELAFAFEFFVRKQGASHLAFETIIAFGENSAYPHHRSSGTRLQKNEHILVDVGAVFDDYCADMTRVFFFGNPDPKIVEMLQIVRNADQIARQLAFPGNTFGQMDRAVRDYFRQAGLEELFTHGLGHGVGLEVHEPPAIRQDGEDRDTMIEAQMVIAIEPGLYQPGLGGVRYENSGVVTEKGFVSFYSEHASPMVH